MTPAHIQTRLPLFVLIRLILAMIGGGVALISLLGLFAARTTPAQAAPAARPYPDIFTGTISITHTSATTHQMVVFGNGRLTTQFLTDNITSTGTTSRTNQIGPSVNHNTIAIRFDQHSGDSVDVGSQNEFVMARPITLETVSTLPGAIEDTYALYTSQALPYQIIQRSLALNSNNCVLMEFFIRNTGGIPLTGGKFLFMLDTQVGELQVSEKGGFDPTRNLLYQTDYNADTDNGYAVGISLLEGSLRGYGAITITNVNAPDPGSDVNLKSKMDSPSNTTIGSNNVIWLVANIPNLAADQQTKLGFSLCARSSYVIDNELEAENQARQNLFLTYGSLVNLEVSKAVSPPSGSSVVAGEPLTYTIAVTSTGEIYVDNIVITDRLPLSTSLIGYSLSQGNLTAANGLVTATVGRLYPTSDTVVMSLVVAPSTSIPDGTIITNQAFIKSEPIVTQTNTVSHQIIGIPDFSLRKAGPTTPAPVVGLPFTYTITITNLGGISDTDIKVIDPLPANAGYVSGGTLEAGNVVSWTIPSLAVNGGKVQVSYVVTTCQESLINSDYQVISSSRGISSDPGPELVSTLAPPTLTPNFLYSPLQPGLAQPVTFTSTSSANGTPIVNWLWDFGDGSTGSGQNPSHAYTSPGNYPVALTVTDSCNYQATVTKTVTIFVPDLVVSKQDNPDPVVAGERLTYTITLVNQGPVEATEVMVFDPVPGDTTFVPGSLVIDPPSVNSAGAPPVLFGGLTLTPGFQLTATYQVTVTAPLTNGTLITNTVSVSSSQVPTPTFTSITSTVSASPELALSKTSSHPTPLQPGNLISYTLALHNNGNANATGVVISDSLPAHTDFVAGSIELTPPTAGQAGTAPPLLANNVTLLAGESLSVTYQVRVRLPLTDETVITNTASVTSAQTSTPVIDTITDLVSSSPSLEIDKRTNYAGALNPGERITYTLVVSNSGTANATGGVISDTWPNNLSLVSGSLRLEPEGAGTLGSFPVLVTNLGVAAGERVTLTFAGVVDFPLANGTVITNTASVTSQEQPLPQFSTVTATVVAAPNLQVEKTGPVTANLLSAIVYTFTLTNEGNTPLQEIELVDDLLGPVTNRLPGSDSNNNNQLDLGESWVYTANYTIPANAPPLITNTVVVTANDGLFTTVTGRDSHTTLIGYSPILRLTKNGPASALVGKTVVFTFRVSHGAGSDGSAVREVKVNDDVAGPATFVSGDNNNNSQLEASEVWTYQVSYVIDATDPNPLINTGTVTAKDQELQPVTASATHTTTLSGFEPLLYVDKDGPAMAEVGETAIYTFTIINIDLLALTKYKLEKKISLAAVGDGSPITVITVTDDLATNVTYLKGDNGNGRLDGGEAWSYRASRIIVPTDPDPLINTVTIEGVDQENDPIKSSDSHPTNISQKPILEIIQTGPAAIRLGQRVELIFEVKHTGESDRTGVKNITVEDSLAGLASRIAGDDNGNGALDLQETWTYVVSYLVPYLSPDPVMGEATVEGRDLDNEVIKVSGSYSLPVTNTGVELLFLPALLKN